MSYALFQIQCLAIELTLALAEREYLRYPPGTIIDGVNVGGQFAVGKTPHSLGKLIEWKRGNAEVRAELCKTLPTRWGN